jgi:hypothetical protein
MKRSEGLEYDQVEYGGLPVNFRIFPILLRTSYFQYCPVSLLLAVFAVDLAAYGVSRSSQCSYPVTQLKSRSPPNDLHWLGI